MILAMDTDDLTWYYFWICWYQFTSPNYLLRFICNARWKIKDIMKK